MHFVQKLFAVSIALGTSLAVSATGYGFVGGQAKIGQRSGTFGTGDTKFNFKGTETQISGQLDPIPILPVGFGLTLANVNVQLKDAPVNTATGILPTIFVWGWVPNPSDFKPFIRIGYTALGRLSGSKPGSKLNYTVSGTQLGLGVEYGIFGPLSALVEFDLENAKVNPNKVEYGGVDVTSNVEKTDFKSNVILVGVDVSF